MKKFSIYLFALFMIPSLMFVSCKDDEIVEPAFETMTKYMVENDLDLGAVLLYHTADADIKFVTGAPAAEADIAAFVAKYYIMDIRAAADYGTGHIETAVNVEFVNILTQAASAGTQPILVVCYSGQTACYATSLLRLYGYENSQALKWGMSGWNTTFDKWTGSIDNIAEGHAKWTTAAAPAPITFADPVLSDNSTDGAAILEARVEAVVAAGFKNVNAIDVLTTPTNYFINNYFSEADYTGFGHIDGAYRVNPLNVADGLINNLDPDAQIVTYCYTGQTSAVITAYLNVLGYEAYSLLYGMNKLNNSNSAWTLNQWGGDSNPKDYPVQ